jgi:hypothetical protein
MAGSAGGIGAGSVAAEGIGSLAGVAGVGSVDGEHAISAAPAISARNVFFMGWESRAGSAAFK